MSIATKRAAARYVDEQSDADRARDALQVAVDDAERELTEGSYVEHDEVMAKLRRWIDDKA